MLPHPEIIEASEVGHVLLVDDGKVKLTVTGTLYFRSVNCFVSLPIW
jgi:pyruvate kinase